MRRRIDELEAKSAQAYQVIGSLLSQCGLFESEEGTRALDYFSQDDYDDDFLPWPRAASSSAVTGC